jgi:peptidoglycan/xylan/chitin deacetylase (PgdA/CDA1 family)
MFNRPLVIQLLQPLVSFTFDDFPKSALHTGGAILRQFGVVGTYYSSLGLAGEETPSGRIFEAADLKLAYEQGHELGCHTFSHCDSGKTQPLAFEQAVLQNQRALDGLLPGIKFQTFSYPISCPRPMAKRRVSRHFRCCRGGGQTVNSGVADLNNLSAYFLEKNRHNIEAVKAIIDHNSRAPGWLIFATHDISDDPTPYGCTPVFFEEVVRYAVASGSRILPVAGALDALMGARGPNTTSGAGLSREPVTP